MLYRCRSLFISISLFLLFACTNLGTSIPSAAIRPTVTPNPDSSLTPTPFGPSAATETLPESNPPATPTVAFTPLVTQTLIPIPAFVPSKYSLSVMMDIAAHLVSVDETITFQNSTGEPLSELVLAVEPNLWKDCFVVKDISVDELIVSGTNLNGDRLDIPLNEPLVPDGTLSLFLHFELHLPAADVYHVFGYNSQQTNLVDWYPFIVPFTRGKGWQLEPPSNVGEHLLYDVENFDMTLHLTGPKVVAIVAASAPAEDISYGWRYRLESVHSFALSVSTDYQTASTKSDGVTVTSYFFDSESAQGKAVLGEVAKAMKTFDLLFGPEPYPKISIVESPFFDGMEFDGLFFLSREYYSSENGTVLNNLIDIAVHETAHQWWFGSVANDQALEPWLDEALATYSERLFYEKNYPDVKAWQAFRIDAYHPAGWVDLDVYHGVNFRMYTNAVYLRGALFLQALRERIGDVAFFAFLKDYAIQMAGKRSTPADFFLILQQHISVDISDIVSQYFQNPY